MAFQDLSLLLQSASKVLKLQKLLLYVYLVISDKTKNGSIHTLKVFQSVGDSLAQH